MERYNIKEEIRRYYRKASNEPLHPRLYELMFPVDARNVYWEESDHRTSGHEPMYPRYTSHYYAIVDRERRYLFTIVSDSYLLITNIEAYWIEQAIAQFVFWRADDNNNYKFVPYSESLRKDRACCNISIARQIDINQPEIKDGWFAAINMVNSYNKSVALSYYIGFVNSRYNISLIFPENAIKFKLKKDKNNDIVGQIADQLAGSKGMYSIKNLEEKFIKKIKRLQAATMDGNMFLAFFCKFFFISKQRIINSKKIAEAIERRDFINKRKEFYINKYGQNAYSFLLGISDYISHYEQRHVTGGNLNFQLQAGQWAEDYLKESSRPDFDLYTYIGKEAFNTASWLNTLDLPRAQDLF